MFNRTLIDEFIEKITQLFPEGMKQMPDNAKQTLRQLLMNLFSQLNLLTYEEFAAQQKVVERLRERIAELEQRIQELEKK